ncbi:MAG: GNAT family N-acetyltransferase [Christensenellaceae bacterium]|jgi:GNAT superfamily N-acetyltransferase|nr:GNAT family N-acetyltransferase [Christensenellaceae bacterium]
MRGESEALAFFRAYLGEERAFTRDLARPGAILALLPGETMLLPEEDCLSSPGGRFILGALRVPEGEFRGIEREGRIVSWAVAGKERFGVRLLTVETEPAFRGRGLAGQALRALCRDLPEEILIYLCDKKNRASLRTAQKAGFELFGKIGGKRPD